jgi:hypothetical protein
VKMSQFTMLRFSGLRTLSTSWKLDRLQWSDEMWQQYDHVWRKAVRQRLNDRFGHRLHKSPCRSTFPFNYHCRMLKKSRVHHMILTNLWCRGCWGHIFLPLASVTCNSHASHRLCFSVNSV